MKMHYAIALFCLLAALCFGVCSGAVFVMHTVVADSGSCEKLEGFPRLLQAAGFVPTGDCKMVDHQCRQGEQCRVDGKRGHCAAVQINGEPRCVCKPNKIGY
jgi:hypothetical protein